jgi:uncharacterized membrane protein (UPF0127 family)
MTDQPNRTIALLAAVVVATIAAVACAPDSAPPETPIEPIAADPTETSSRPVVELPAVLLPDGFEVNLELAITPDELAQGLMYRPRLADDHGMLLVFDEERFPSIWMMNTLVALDIIYLDRTGTVVDVITDAQPCPAEPCPRFTPKQAARAVLEVPAGTAAQHGIAAGARLEFSHVPDFPVGD